jgi:hypothetical protein
VIIPEKVNEMTRNNQRVNSHEGRSHENLITILFGKGKNMGYIFSDADNLFAYITVNGVFL